MGTKHLELDQEYFRSWRRAKAGVRVRVKACRANPHLLGQETNVLTSEISRPKLSLGARVCRRDSMGVGVGIWVQQEFQSS